MKQTGKIILENSIKTFTDDQDKLVPPQETIRKFKSRLNAQSKILDSTVRIDNGRLGIPVFFSACGIDAYDIIGTKKQMGKGATSAQAEASAIMELAERYSFFSYYKDPNNVFVDTYKNISLSNNVLPFDLIARSVDDQSNDLEISEEIFKSLPLKWTGAYNFTNEEEVLIPLNWFYAINAFNGPSSGNCVEEAICQGICEVVERHVSALISREKLASPTIKLDSITNPFVIDMLGKYHNSNIKIHITDFTMGMGIPSIGIIAYDPKTFPKSSEIVWTAGTATSPQKALSRTLTEVAQLSGDFNTGSNYLASGLPKLTSIDELSSLYNEVNKISIEDLPDVSDQNIKIEVENCVKELSKLNMSTIVVDITHPTLKIPSFYTIVPGASFRERAAKTSVAMFSAKIITENFDTYEAIKRLKSINKLLPKKYFIQFYIGKCYLELRQYDLAIFSFSEATSMNPTKQDMVSIYSYLAVCFKNLNKYKKAIQILDKGERLDSYRTDIHNLKGFCNFMLKNYGKAIDSFKRVIEIDPSSAIDYANIASCYRDMGNNKKAVHYYTLALSIDPSIEFAGKNLEALTC